MAGVISEVRAKFSASAQGMMNSIREMREGVQNFANESQSSMTSANTAVNNFQDTLNSTDTNQLTQEMNQAGNAVDSMGSSAASTLNQLQQELGQVGTAAGDMGDVIHVELSDAERYAQAAEKGFAGLRKTFLNWTAAAAGVTLIAGSMGGLVAINETYTQALNQVVSSTGATEEETAQLGQSLQNIYANNYGADFLDIANSMSEVEKATKLTGTALEIVTESALALRDTFGYEVAESSKVASTMMKQFGISADEAYELMAQGAQEGLDVSGDMMDSFNEYSVYFKTLGFDAEGMWNVFKAGADGGAFNMDKVGDAIKELGIRVKDGSKTTAEGFAAIGLDADKMAADFAKGGDSAQNALQKTFAGLAAIEDPVKRNAAGVSLFGTQFEDLEYNTIKAMGTVRNEANMTGQAMDTIRQVKYNSVTEAIQGMGRQLVVSLINPIQEKVMPVVNDMVNAFKANMPQIQTIVMSVFNTITNVVAALAPTFNNVFGILKNVAPAILTPLGLAFQGLSAVIAPIANYVTGLVNELTGMKYFAPILAGLITAFTTFQIGVKLAAAAQVAWATLTRAHTIILNAFRAAVLLLNSAWLANPIVLIVALLAGLGVALYMAYQKSETFREIVNKAWAGIKAGAEVVFNWFTVTLPAWVASVIQYFTNLWNTTKAKAAEWGTALQNTWTNVKTAVLNFVDTIKNFFLNAWSNIQSGIMSFVNVVKGYFNNFVNNIMYIVEPIIDFFKRTWENVKNVVLGIVGVFIGLITGDMKAVQNALKLIWQSIKDQIINFVTTIKDTATRLFEIMKSGLINIGNGIKNGLTAAWNAIVSGGKAAWEGLKNGVIAIAKALWSSVTSTWESLKNGVVNAAKSTWKGAVSAFESMKSAAISTVKGMYDSVVSWFKQIPQKASEAGSNLVSTFKKINLRSIGSDIIKGLVNGLGDMLGSLKKKAKEIADTVKNAIADKLKIKSPSRVMMGMGVNVGEGLEIGMSDMIRKVGRTAANMAGAVTDNMDLSGALGGGLTASASLQNMMTLKHVIDLANVPQGMSEGNLIQAIKGALGDPRIKRQIDRVNAENNLNYLRPLGGV